MPSILPLTVKMSNCVVDTDISNKVDEVTVEFDTMNVEKMDLNKELEGGVNIGK
jgi:hypothetical protein